MSTAHHTLLHSGDYQGSPPEHKVELYTSWKIFMEDRWSSQQNTSLLPPTGGKQMTSLS